MSAAPYGARRLNCGSAATSYALHAVTGPVTVAEFRFVRTVKARPVSAPTAYLQLGAVSLTRDRRPSASRRAGRRDTSDATAPQPHATLPRPQLRRPTPAMSAHVVTLVPPHEALDYSYFQHRLADPALLRRSLGLHIHTGATLAVPVGGSRRGGYTSSCCLRCGWRLRNALKRRDGFPRVRLVWSLYPGARHVVRWGERVPASWDDAVLGRFYGYSQSAIAAYLGVPVPAGAAV